MKPKVSLKLLSVFFCLVLLLVSTACKLPGTGNGDNEGNNNEGNTGNTETKTKWQMWSGGTNLRGANIYQRRIYIELDGSEFMGSGVIGPPFTQEDFDRLSEMGANYVNISHPGIFDETPPYQLSAAILDNLQQLVEKIGKADMFAVISFRTGPGRSEFTFFWGEGEDWFDAGYYNDTIWTDISAQAAWIEMWQETARQFADNPYVVGYDLMVEPNSNDVWFDIWDPVDFYLLYAGSLYDWNQLYPRVSDAIREVDNDTPILMGGMSYSSVKWLPYMEITGDPRTVYTFHQYQPHLYTHQAVDGTYTYPGYIDTDWDGIDEYVDKSWLDRLLSNADEFIAGKGGGTVVVACNEYGIVRWVPGAAVFMDDLMDLFEQRGFNYALWEWGPSYTPYAEEVNAFNFRFGPDPGSTQDVESSHLLEVIKSYWAQNTLRPSDVQFKNRSR
jgi:hypothetical protein